MNDNDIIEALVLERDATGRQLVWLRADLIKIAEALGILNERSNRDHIRDAETKSFGYWRDLASQITDRITEENDDDGII